jgi:hypothetical protein
MGAVNDPRAAVLLRLAEAFGAVAAALHVLDEDPDEPLAHTWHEQATTEAERALACAEEWIA